MSASSDEDEEGRPQYGSGKGRQPDLTSIKQLSAQLLRGRACRAIPLVPVEQLQRLLKVLDAHLLCGRDKVLHREEQVYSYALLSCAQQLTTAQNLMPRNALIALHGNRYLRNAMSWLDMLQQDKNLIWRAVS